MPNTHQSLNKRKTSLTLNAEALDAARALGVNVSAVADQAVTQAHREKWLAENAEAFAAQAKWHEENAHPLADIMAGPAAATWKD